MAGLGCAMAAELYYWTASRTSVAIKAIRITLGPPSSWGAPNVIVEGAYATTTYDTDNDVWQGRFLLMKDSTADGARPGREIVFVQNWLEELGWLVPVKTERWGGETDLTVGSKETSN